MTSWKHGHCIIHGIIYRSVLSREFSVYRNLQMPHDLCLVLLFSTENDCCSVVFTLKSTARLVRCPLKLFHVISIGLITANSLLQNHAKLTPTVIFHSSILMFGSELHAFLDLVSPESESCTICCPHKHYCLGLGSVLMSKSLYRCCPTNCLSGL